MPFTSAYSRQARFWLEHYSDRELVKVVYLWLRDVLFADGMVESVDITLPSGQEISHRC